MSSEPPEHPIAVNRGGASATGAEVVKPRIRGVRGRNGQRDVLVAIAVGGILGAEARNGIADALPHPASGFPWSTLLINASGCFLIGVLMVLITEIVTPHRLLRPFLGVGVLGGFTTFSTYAVDTQRLLVAGRPGVALAYLGGTLVAAMAAVWTGATATRVAGGRWAVRAEDDSS